MARIPVRRHESFVWDFRRALALDRYDLIVVSQVFCESSFRIEWLSDLVSACDDPSTTIIIDGYHGYGSVPTSLKAIEDRVYYLGGGYKYAQARYGEGLCFLTVPARSHLKPKPSSGFTEFHEYGSHEGGRIAYPSGDYAFWGETLDPAAFYRLNAVVEWLDAARVKVADLHAHAGKLHRHLLSEIDQNRIRVFHRDHFVSPRNPAQRGHFLVYDCVSPRIARGYQDELRERGVTVDTRRSLMRIGFAPYHDESDVDALISEFARLKPNFL